MVLPVIGLPWTSHVEVSRIVTGQSMHAQIAGTIMLNTTRLPVLIDNQFFINQCGVMQPNVES